MIQLIESDDRAFYHLTQDSGEVGLNAILVLLWVNTQPV